MNGAWPRSLPTGWQRLHSLGISVALALLSACASDSAVLEVFVDLPAAEGGEPIYAVLQAREAATNTFESAWLRDDDLPGVRLVDGERSEDHISLISVDDAVDVNVKVRFCRSERCEALVDASSPELWFALEHPFYLGARTEWRLRLERGPRRSPHGPRAGRSLPHRGLRRRYVDRLLRFRWRALLRMTPIR